MHLSFSDLILTHDNSATVGTARSPEPSVALVAELEVALLTLSTATRNVAVDTITKDARVLA